MEEKFNVIFNNRYDYSNTVFKGARFPITVECPEHGPFVVKSSDHLDGCGCLFCLGKDRINNDEYKAKLKSIWGTEKWRIEDIKFTST